jgi:hypothetical protein
MWTGRRAWLIRRAIDPGAVFVFVDDPDEVPADATAFDMRGADLSHHGGDCTFETMLLRYGLILPAQALRAFAYGLGAVLLGVTLDQRGYLPFGVGVVLTAVVAGTVVASLLLARYGDRAGRRRCYMIMYLLLAVTGVVFAFAVPLWALLAASLTGALSTEVVESGPFTSLEQPMLAAGLGRGRQVAGFSAPATCLPGSKSRCTASCRRRSPTWLSTLARAPSMPSSPTFRSRGGGPGRGRRRTQARWAGLVTAATHMAPVWACCAARVLPWGSPAAWAACDGGPCRVLRPGSYAVMACFWSLLVTWMLRGLAASWTGMVRVSTPAA